MRALIITLLILVFHTPSISRAETSVEQAVTCFDTMLEDAKSGTSFSIMVEKYVLTAAIAARAVQVQKKIIWASMSDSEREPYLQAVRAYFSNEAAKVEKGVGARDYVDINTVELRPRQHKKVGEAVQLSGVYKTVSGGPENFALTVIKNGGRCYILDARWRDAWLSRFLPL